MLEHQYIRGVVAKLAEHNIAPSAFVDAAIRSNNTDAIKVAGVIIPYLSGAVKEAAPASLDRLKRLARASMDDPTAPVTLKQLKQVAREVNAPTAVLPTQVSTPPLANTVRASEDILPTQYLNTRVSASPFANTAHASEDVLPTQYLDTRVSASPFASTEVAARDAIPTQQAKFPAPPASTEVAARDAIPTQRAKFPAPAQGGTGGTSATSSVPGGAPTTAPQAMDEAERRRLLAYTSAGVGSAATLGLGAYGMGDADTMSNRMRNASNEYLGTDFDTQSRLSHGWERLQRPVIIR